MEEASARGDLCANRGDLCANRRMSRQASVIVADDATYTLSGKLNITGIYTTDIIIPNDPVVGAQLVFLFVIETEPGDPYQKLELRVDLPGGDSRQVPINLGGLRDGQSDKIRWSLKFPLLFQGPILKPGPIVATVIHEKGILLPGAPLIIMTPVLPPIPTPPSRSS